MSFQDKLREIDRLRSEIEDHGKLGRELLQKINYKFRLDWNYYSNRMEGNTLTIDETKSVMVHNLNVRDKPLKDVMEMKGHDDAIQVILKMGKGELNISEGRVKELHKAIMYEESPVEAQKIGKWKSQPNHVINYKEEKFDFADPSEVVDKMHDLINWINAEKEKIQAGKKNALHPVELAFEFHLRYLTIHPFYDGNGRTGRILTNLILISYGYPPIYVKDADKRIYYRYLADVQAYAVDKYMFFEIMAGYLIRSLNIVRDAIAGKDISEPDDLDKKLQLLEKELSAIDSNDEVRIKYSGDVFLNSYETWISKLLVLAVPVIQKFNKLFTEVRHQISIPEARVYTYFSNEPVTEITSKFKGGIQQELEQIGQVRPEVRLQANYGNFTKGGLNSFGCNYSINIKFHDIKYEVFVDRFDETTLNRKVERQYERLLHQTLTEDNMNDIVTLLGDTIFTHIDYYTKKYGLRQ